MQRHNVYDVPLLDAEDVEHTSRGLCITRHGSAELKRLSDAMQPWQASIVMAMQEKRLLIAGGAAAKFFRTMPATRDALRTLGSAILVPHPCNWIPWTWTLSAMHAEALRAIHVKLQLALAAAAVSPLPNVEAFETILQIIHHDVRTIRSKEVWAEMPSAKRAAIGAKSSQTKAAFTPAKKAFLKKKRNDTMAKKTPEERSATRRKRSLAWARRSLAQKLASKKKFQATSASRTQEQNTAKASKHREAISKRTATQRLESRQKLRTTLAARPWLKVKKQQHVLKVRSKMLENLRKFWKDPEKKRKALERYKRSLDARPEEAKAATSAKRSAIAKARLGTAQGRQWLSQMQRSVAAKRTPEERKAHGKKIAMAAKASGAHKKFWEGKPELKKIAGKRLAASRDAASSRKKQGMRDAVAKQLQTGSFEAVCSEDRLRDYVRLKKDTHAEAIILVQKIDEWYEARPGQLQTDKRAVKATPKALAAKARANAMRSAWRARKQQDTGAVAVEGDPKDVV